MSVPSASLIIPDHLVEAVGVLRADVVDAGQLVVGGEFAGAGDVADMGEIPRLAAVAEQFRGLPAGDGVGELGDRVGVLAFVFLVAAEALIHRKESQAGHVHVVVMGVVLGVAFAGEFRGLVGRLGFHLHTLRRGFSPAPVDRGGRSVDDGLTALFFGLFDGIDESLDVDATAALWILLVHISRGERGEVEQHVDIGRQAVVEDRGFDELDGVVEVFGRAEIRVVDSDHVVVLGEVVGEVRADEPGSSRHEDALVVHN